jgi:tRNA-guanine family transglycosylase
MSNEITGAVLSTLHNVFFYLDLVRKARESIVAGRFDTFRQETLRGFSA